MSLSALHPVMRKFSPWMLILLSVIVTVVAYLQALDAPFVSDDQIYITENTRLAGLHFTELWRLFIEPYNPYEFLPLRDLSYRFDITLFGLTPAAFRIHNIILYLLSVPLVYAVTTSLWRYLRPAQAGSAAWPAAVVTALFVLHPAHVEAVVWISGRKDVLAGLFSLLSLWLAMQAKRERGLASGYAAAAMIALLLALLSKATAVAVAPVIAMLWIFFWRDIPVPERRRALLIWPLMILLLAVVSISLLSFGHSVRAPAYFGIEVFSRALAALGELSRLAISPEGRHFYYPGLDDPQLNIMIACGTIVLMLALCAVVMAWRNRSLEWIMLCVFVVLCVPYLQLMPYVTSSLVSDRFLTLAIWPVLFLIVALIWRLEPVSRTISLLIIACLWGLQTVERPRDWNDFDGLVQLDELAYPGYYMPLMNKVNVQLTHKAFNDANQTAGAISSSVLKNITYGIIQADQAVLVTSPYSGNPDEAIAILSRLQYALQHPPEQIKWNPAVQSFWGFCQNRLVLQWQALIRQFPDDESVRFGAQGWMSYMGQ